MGTEGNWSLRAEYKSKKLNLHGADVFRNRSRGWGGGYIIGIKLVVYIVTVVLRERRVNET